MAFSMAWLAAQVEGKTGDDRARELLAAFRGELYRSFATYRDALLELADAVLCKRDRVHMLAELSLEPEHRRGHGALYGAVNCGRVDIARLRWSLACLPLPAWDDGRIRLAVDVSNWLRPDAATSPDRLFCHCYARGKGNAQLIPGWPYSLVAALEPGRTSWTLPLDVIRLGPADDATEVTAAQVREVIGQLAGAGHWHDGDPDILVVFDSGYDLTRLAWLLADLPVEIMGRLRSDRVMYFPAPPRPARPAGTSGRPPRHGAALKLSDPQTWPVPVVTTSTQTTRYGTAQAMAWGRLHQQLASRGSWEDHDARCRSSRAPSSGLPSITCPATAARNRYGCGHHAPGTSGAEVDRTWQAFLRRFDLEHTFRFLKQVLGWTRPKLRDPAAADRWTWLIIACYAQLYLARDLAADIRLPWQRPCPPGRLTPPGSAAGSATSARCCPARPARQNPANPAPAARPDQKTGARPPATTWERPSSGMTPRRKTAGRQLK